MVATMRQLGTRKRPASAMSPSDQVQVQEVKNPNRNSDPPTMMQNATFQMQNISNGPPYDPNFTSNYTDPTGNYPDENGTPYYSNQAMQSQERSENPTTDLVRTQPGTQVLSVNYGYPGTGPEYGGLPQSAESQWQGQGHGEGRYDDLDHRALLAQRDAQAKRKQIPPFVQKLSSFLNNNTQNTDLIRWSDSGDSFVVVDEDEFAKTLIPELFKHNNYASFVRQLNMYGFHKKVGLSDNSMRASERKNKNPSEYSNPYFKRGKPNLLWLIHKPKNASSKVGGKGNNRAKQEDAEEDADDLFPRDSAAPSGLEPIEDGHSWNSRQPLMLGSADKRPPPDQLESLRQEMAEIRSNQRKITEMLKQSRRENAQLYGQAKTYHEMHQKHDKSITAILNFLATFYSQNLPGGASGLDHGHGNIVDVGDDKERNRLATSNQARFRRRQPLLLKDKASPVQLTGDSERWNPNQWPEGTFSYPTKPKSPPLRSPAVHEINGDTPSARFSDSPPLYPDTATDGQIPQQDVLSMLNSTSALNNSNITDPTMDFSEALSHLQTAHGQTPLTPSQQQNMLQLMSDEQAKSPQDGNHSNTNKESSGLASYSPSNMNANLAQITMNAEQLSQIEQSLREQEQRMANMQATIAPLSPSGSIPGVNDQSYGGQNGAHDFDFDSMFKSDDYFNDGGDPNNYNFAVGADLPDFDFGTGTKLANGDSLQGPAQLDVPDDGRVKEMDSSEATSPANTVATMEAEDANDGEQVDRRPTKRRRRG